jgi:transposase
MVSSSSRRIVGLDLGVASAHTAQVIDEQGQVVCKRRVVPTVAGFAALEDAALAGAAPGTGLEVVIEPTGAAWLPVAVWFTRCGHTVFRVSTQKAHDLRRFLSRHAKSNSIDAHTLARLPLIDPGGLHPVHLPGAAAEATLDRRVRAAAPLTDEIGRYKRRLIELARQAMPTIGGVFTPKLSRTDLAVLERYGDPRRLASVRRERLVALIAKVGHNQGDPAAKATRCAPRPARHSPSTTRTRRSASRARPPRWSPRSGSSAPMITKVRSTPRHCASSPPDSPSGPGP